MANQNLYSASQENNQSAEIKKTPNIRTMGSDVSAYAKAKNLSRVSIAAEELKRTSAIPETISEQNDSSRRATKIIIAALGALAMIAVIAATGVYFYYRILPKPKFEETKPAITVYFSSEKLETITLAPEDILALKLIASSQTPEPDNTIKRIAVLFANNEETQTPISAKNFFRLLRIPAPALIAGDEDIMPFFYYQGGVARAGFLIPVRDENLALQTMISWEASIQKDLSPLFLQELPETASASFEDKIFKNINYRFLKLSQTKDFGIGYFLFPAKHYLVITTSEASLQSVIARLFEAK
ncbi:hypothetical protein KGQ34_04770 [Patescibacteria group bacterium]|nr:hypothetical protein [Patescibacteria group bacterium]